MTWADADVKDRRQALASVPVSHETEKRLAVLVAELRRWQSVKNLVGQNSLKEVWTRHVADSAQLFALAPDASRWLDLGSGGGFPGLVIGIMLAERGAGEVHLIESNGRKCAFLRAAARVTGALAHVHQGRIESEIHRFVGTVDAVTARAVAPLPTLLQWTKDLLRTGAVGLFPRGQDIEAELTESSKCWNIHGDVVASRTDAASRILIVRSLQPRPEP